MTNPNTAITKEGFHVLKNDTHISRWVEEHKNLTCDPYLFEWLLPRLKDVEVVWDIGAFIGDHTLSYLSLPKVRTVHAFEPNPDAFHCLYRNVGEKSNLARKAVCWNVAASDHRDSLIMNLNDNVGASRLTEDGSGIRVRAVKLDTFMADTTPPDFVKLDVEGWELNALKGMAKMLRRAKPIVFIEVNRGALAANRHSREHLDEFFSSIGYPPKFYIYPVGATRADDQYDLLFTP